MKHLLSPLILILSAASAQAGFELPGVYKIVPEQSFRECSKGMVYTAAYDLVLSHPDQTMFKCSDDVSARYVKRSGVNEVLFFNTEVSAQPRLSPTDHDYCQTLSVKTDYGYVEDADGITLAGHAEGCHTRRLYPLVSTQWRTTCLHESDTAIEFDTRNGGFLVLDIDVVGQTITRRPDGSVLVVNTHKNARRGEDRESTCVYARQP